MIESMKLPDNLEPYRGIAEEYLAENRIGDIEFSGATYQVQVSDFNTDQPVWAFIQLDKSGSISDAFCSCESEDESNACAHTAAAFLYLYHIDGVPLHQRFYRSLWYFLCNRFAERSDYSTECLKKEGDRRFAWRSPSGKLLFEMEAKNEEGWRLIHTFLTGRDEETEETSLKFSNLTPEEIQQWKEGKPSSQLKFELSFWNELAKWIMLRQDRKMDDTIDFGLSAGGFPNWIHVDLGDMAVGFYLSRANLPNVIPLLTTVNCPYEVRGVGEADIESITYDQETGKLHIETSEQTVQHPADEIDVEKSVDLGNWLFVPHIGFFAKSHHSLLGERSLEGEEIAWVFKEHLETVEKKLEGTRLYADPMKISYALHFDPSWNLHIESFLIQPGDMTQPFSKQYGNWFYVQDDGFYQTEPSYFDQIATLITPDEMAGFIAKNKLWLNSQEGFHTYLASVDTQVYYRVDEKGNVWFESGLQDTLEGEEHHDFGNWVYVPGAGFYQKTARHLGIPVMPGSCLDPPNVAPTIRMYRDELNHIKGFFSERCPVASSKLHIGLNDEGRITHFLHHEVKPEYADTHLRFYGDFVYAPNEGFHELPLPPGFPKEYLDPKVIPIEGEEVFIHFDLPYMRELADEVDPRLQQPKKVQLTCKEISEESGLYHAHLHYQSEIGQVPAVDLWKGIHEKKQFVFTNAGIVDLEEDRFRWLRGVKKGHVDVKKKQLTLSALEILKLNAFDHIEHSKGKTGGLLKQITSQDSPTEPDTTGLKSELRPYQQIGLKWLWSLYHHHLSGLLCDDMGLGKTHQSMALIQAVRNSQTKPMHFLVVCPTSVIYHWQSKLHAYLPELRVCTFYGQNRSMEGFHQEYDVLLTSYGVWRREVKLLKETEFEVAVFDEVQMAKNRKSKLHHSLTQANAKFRLGLTGTPIENHLQELKALFDIVLPGYMPGEEEFNHYFAKPIEKNRDLQKQLLLRKFVSPFILRRKKEEVLTDLPEKIEEISFCPLLPEQRKYYQNMLSASKKEIIKQLDKADQPIPFVHVFALLSKLKQICNHPAVVLKEPENYKKHSSGKWDLFVELLNEARESQQKVVVFSQYLAQLDIIENYLSEHQIGYAGIRGSTSERGKQIERFNQDPSCEVFVASLQAAGLGIDLTAASVVIHYDRWWNAARENQATDRVHRIGQSRGVQVFKMVTRGTFEEKIHAMIERKGKLMEDIVGMDDQQMIKQLDRQQILELLQDVHLGAEDQQDLITDT